MGDKTPEKRFAAKMAALGEVLKGLKASDSNVQKLGRLFPRLKPSGVSNEIKGSEILGDVIQVGSRLGGVWDEASKLVGKIGSQELSQAYIEAAAAVAACRATTTNSIEGATIHGTVIQADNITGGINFRDF